MYGFSGRKIIDRRKFYNRVFTHTLIGIGLIAAGLFIGMVGYHEINRLSWIDSFLNASMILSGMGPVDPLISDEAKLFAGTYAIFSGVVFLIVVGIVFAPVLHRLLHRYHLDSIEDGNTDQPDAGSENLPDA